MIGVCDGWACQAGRLLEAAYENLAHENHGVDLCFGCFLQGEIDKLLKRPRHPRQPVDGA